MAVRFGDDFIDELCSRVSIEDVIGETVSLKKKGSKLWACCPFHGEKTPSFSVSPDKGMYYCFGCHKGGNVITFMKDYYKLDFMDAVKELAQRAHMQMPAAKDYNPEEDARKKALKERIYEANRIAAHYFHDNIWTEAGAEGLKYFYGRGLTDADIKHFGLGYAPGHGELYRLLKDKGFTDQELSQAWLIGEKDGRRFDMFAGRVIFPIIDTVGRVLGFGGRIMGKGEPKYLNTSDTPIFSKRNNLYGLNYVKGHSVSRFVQVEGYMDTVALLRYGVTGVVATLGTSLTEDQVKLMKRYVKEVWISYDGDPPGRKSALRALDMLEPAGLTVKVVDYPGNRDPDEYLKEFGRESWEQLPKLTGTEYRMRRAKDDLDLSTENDMATYATRCCEILKRVGNAIELETYVRRLANETGYGRDVLLRQIGLSMPEPQPKIQNTAYRQDMKPRKETRLDKAQIQLIALTAEGMLPKGMLRRQDFDDSLYAEIFEYLSDGINPRDFIEQLPEEQTRKALEALNFSPLPDSKEKAVTLAEELLHTIDRERTNSRITLLMEKLKTANEAEKQEYTKELSALLAKLD